MRRYNFSDALAALSQLIYSSPHWHGGRFVALAGPAGVPGPPSRAGRGRQVQADEGSQIVAHQVGVGIFKIWNGFSGDFAVGEGGQEPLQLGVRAVIERATAEMVANLYGMPGPEACMQSDPLGDHVTTGPTGAFVPAYNNVATNNAATRQDPNRWNARREPARDPDRDSSGDGVVRDRY